MREIIAAAQKIHLNILETTDSPTITNTMAAIIAIIGYTMFKENRLSSINY